MKPEDAPRLREWMVATEIAEEFGVTRTTVNKMIHAGEFSTLVTLGGDARRPQYAVKRGEVMKMKEGRSFPRSGPAGKAEDEPAS